MFSQIANFIERCIRWFIITITNYLPVKVIRDEKGIPFLYRYHLFALTNDGPGMCIHRFVKSDPDRGYHDHPWEKSLSFILCGRYDERILNKESNSYITHKRNRWTFNYLNGVDTFHRVMVEEGKDVWTLFMFQKRNKTWGMISLDGQYKQMSTTVNDRDGGWWNHVMKGLGLWAHLEQSGKVIATVDTVIIAESKILLIKRGKEPYKGKWAFPGGRIDSTDKDILSAAYRELREETHLSEDKLSQPLKYFKTIGNSTRDPRGFCLTNVFIAQLTKTPKVKADDDAVDYEWFDLNNLPDMAFDHKEIMEEIKVYQAN